MTVSRASLVLPAAFALGVLAGGALIWPDSASVAANRSPETIRLPAWNPADPGSGSRLSDVQIRPAVDAWLARTTGYTTRVDTLRTLLVTMPDSGLSRIAGALIKRTKPDDQRLLEITLGVWAERDPAAAVRWAFVNQAKPGTILWAWVSLDPVAASTWACTLPDENQIMELGVIALAGLFEKDPARTFALLDSLAPEIRTRLLSRLLQAFGKNDPGGTLRRLGPTLWNDANNHQDIRRLISDWARTDPRAAIDWLLAQPFQDAYVRSDWLSSLSFNNREKVGLLISIYSTLPALPNRAEVIARTLMNAARDQPDQVLSWVAGVPDPQLRSSVLLRLASSYAHNQPESSLHYALALPEGLERTQKLKWMLGSWASEDPAAALAWMNAHDDPGVAAVAYSAQAQILGNIAKDEPETALAAWSGITDAATRKAALLPIAQSWGKNDPGAALRWLHEQNQALSTGGFPGYSDLIYAWRQREPEAALIWTEQLALSYKKNGVPSPRLDLIEALNGDSNNSPDRTATADLYAKIQHTGLRTEALTRHLRKWLQFDRKTATRWLESHDALSPEAAAKLIAEAQSP